MKIGPASDLDQVPKPKKWLTEQNSRNEKVRERRTVMVTILQRRYAVD